MKKKLFSVLALSVFTAFPSLWGSDDRPNLLVILVDDMGYQDVGFNGCKDILTPHIDKIAQQGVIFTDGYVSYPVCGPSRAGLMTGRYQDRFGFTTNPTIDPKTENAGIPLEEENMAEILRKADYKSAIIGKWHLGSHPKQHPLSRGFDYFYGFLSGGHQYFPEELTLNDLSEVTEKWDWYRTRILENHTRIDIDDYLTDELTDAAIRFMNEKSEENEHFFCYLAYNAPHTPLQATEKYLSRFAHIKDKKRKTYAAMVSAVDDGVGRILNALEKSGELDNTMIFFLSDNGGPENHNASDNGPLRGRKGDVFEGGFRVPFTMMWKDRISAGQVFRNPVISLDILATIADINKIQIAAERPLDGTNLVPYLTGEIAGKPHDVLFWRKWDSGDVMAIRSDNLKLLKNKEKDNGHALFDLSKDLGESNNLINRLPEKAEQLMQDWEQWNSQLKDRQFKTLGDDKWW